MTANLPRDEPRRNACRAASRRSLALAELLAESVASSSGGRRIPIRGHCMTPLIREGDLVTVVTDEATPRLGELWLAPDQAGEIICHRVLASGPPLELAGDASQRVDHVEPGAVIGRVVSVHRSGRTLRLDRGGWRWLAPLLGAWHHATRSHLHRPAVRGLEILRRMSLRILSLCWLAARVS